MKLIVGIHVKGKKNKMMYTDDLINVMILFWFSIEFEGSANLLINNGNGLLLLAYLLFAIPYVSSTHTKKNDPKLGTPLNVYLLHLRTICNNMKQIRCQAFGVYSVLIKCPLFASWKRMTGKGLQRLHGGL